jgi:preprotein translocase subunit SecE
VARNRKRAKERRDRRTNGALDRPRLSAADAEAAAEAVPGPIEHAAPDVDLADAQIAMGSPNLGGPEISERELELEEERENGQPEAPAQAVAVGARPRPSLLARVVGFLQGSWRELQRVQWPDRRQVAQATGVVLGFVVVAGVFLGLADLAASHLMTFILK